MDFDVEQYKVKPGEQIDLEDRNPDITSPFEDQKSQGKSYLDYLTDELKLLQERMYAEKKHAILMILQGMDTCGKDGTVKHVFNGVNPQGIRIANFKVPTEEELAHDFLWRVHQQTPAKGEIVIFNRSQYEDVLIVRVHELAPEKVWSKRFGHINDFERELADEGTTILKFFLNISKKEQTERLLDRLDETDKQWKFNPDDLKERKLWDDYINAYEDAISMTSTEWAPWYIVPADHKWYRNLVVAKVLVDTLKELHPEPRKPFSKDEIKEYQDKLD